MVSSTLQFKDFEKICENNRLYQKLDQKERAHLFKLASRRKYKAKEVIFYSSERDANEFYIVEEGELELNLNSGKEKIYRKGKLFGEISILDGSPRTGTMTAITDVSLIVFNGDLLFSERIMPVHHSLSIFKGLVSYVIGYLEEEYVYATEGILKKGEGVTIEFKESLSKSSKKVIVKTICAFLNTRGGTILIGVKDDGTVVGVDIASEKDLDHYKQSLVQILRDRVGANFTTNIHFNTEKINDKILLRINCTPSRVPAILEDKEKQYFYMRSGPSDIKAPNIKELISYYQKRFGKSI